MPSLCALLPRNKSNYMFDHAYVKVQIHIKTPLFVHIPGMVVFLGVKRRQLCTDFLPFVPSVLLQKTSFPFSSPMESQIKVLVLLFPCFRQVKFGNIAIKVEGSMIFEDHSGAMITCKSITSSLERTETWICIFRHAKNFVSTDRWICTALYSFFHNICTIQISYGFLIRCYLHN